MLFAHLADAEADQQKAEEHDRKSRQTQLPIRQRKYLPEQTLDPMGRKEPGDTLDHQNHAQDRR
jgi:hypothetical protein